MQSGARRPAPRSLEDLTAQLRDEDHDPLPDAVRDQILDAAGIFERSLGEHRDLRAAMVAKRAVFIARALLDFALCGWMFCPDGETAGMRAQHLVDRVLRFATRRRKTKRKRGAPRAPSHKQLRAAFGPDAPLVASLWPAIRFLAAAYPPALEDESVVRDGADRDSDAQDDDQADAQLRREQALWREAEALHVSLGPDVVGEALAAAARGTIRADFKVGETWAQREHLSIARVSLAVQEKRDAIYDTYEPSWDPDKVPAYLTTIAKRAIADSPRSTEGPKPSTWRNYRRQLGSEQSSKLDEDQARKRYEDGIAKQQHHDPEKRWEPLSVVAMDLAGRFGCSSRTVYDIFHQERAGGRLSASKGSVSWQVTRAARNALIAALRRYTGRPRG